MNDTAGIDPGGKPVALEDIPGELRALWRAAATGQSSGVTRALLINFVLRVAPGGDLAAASRTVARVAAALPCRAFVLVETARRDGPAPLSAWVASHCMITGPGKQVCCEQVTLAAQAGAADALAAQLLALLVPDLPTVLYWPAGDIDTGLFARVARESDRVIVDSATFAEPERALVRWAELARAPGSRVEDDLAWTRLEPWRDLAAAPFDAPPFDRLLSTVHAAGIVHTARGTAPAWLFAGWLASRLAWRLRSRAGSRFEFDAPNGRTSLVLETTTDPGHAGAELVHVALAAGDDTRFEIGIDAAHPGLLASRVARTGACPLPRHRERRARDHDEDLVRVLQRRPPNPAFDAALAAAAALCALPA